MPGRVRRYSADRYSLGGKVQSIAEAGDVGEDSAYEVMPFSQIASSYASWKDSWRLIAFHYLKPDAPESSRDACGFIHPELYTKGQCMSCSNPCDSPFRDKLMTTDRTNPFYVRVDEYTLPKTARDTDGRHTKKDMPKTD